MRLLLNDEAFMSLALEQARAGARLGEVPVGALLVFKGQVIASGHNLRERLNDPCAHAELRVIQQASQVLKRWRLTGATLYVTLEPCVMCMGAALLSRVERIVYGAKDPRGGAAGSLFDLSQDPRLNHRIVVRSGVLEQACGAMLSDFFQGLRQATRKARGSRLGPSAGIDAAQDEPVGRSEEGDPDGLSSSPPKD